MASVSADPKKRFSGRVENYSLYRPGYPAEAMQYIFDRTKINSQSSVADIGAGTGIFTELLLSSGSGVIAVEPNESMRLAADNILQGNNNYSSIAGSAEATGLASHSIDLITAAQAFHWFKLAEAKTEFNRILKPQGKIVLIWNRRDEGRSAFMRQYASLLQSRLPEYNKVNHANATDERIGDFLGANMQKAEFPSYQRFDLVGLKGRLLSSSYCPAVGADSHEEIMAELEILYEQHASETGVQFDYITQVYLA